MLSFENTFYFKPLQHQRFQIWSKCHHICSGFVKFKKLFLPYDQYNVFGYNTFELNLKSWMSKWKIYLISHFKHKMRISVFVCRSDWNSLFIYWYTVNLNKLQTFHFCNDDIDLWTRLRRNKFRCHASELLMSLLLTVISCTL